MTQLKRQAMSADDDMVSVAECYKGLSSAPRKFSHVPVCIFARARCCQCSHRGVVHGRAHDPAGVDRRPHASFPARYDRRGLPACRAGGYRTTPDHRRFRPARVAGPSDMRDIGCLCRPVHRRSLHHVRRACGDHLCNMPVSRSRPWFPAAWRTVGQSGADC